MGLGLLVGYLAADRRAAETRLPNVVRRIPPLANVMLRRGIPYREYADTLKRFEAVNECLIGAHQQPHHEPEFLPEELVFSCQMWGYSGLHHLRQFAAYLALNRPLYVPERKLHEAYDEVVAEYYALAQERELPYQHLMHHGDADGMYIPQNFRPVIHPPDRFSANVGGTIGSSVQLLQECQSLAAILQLPLELDIAGEELWAAADSPRERPLKWQQFGIESFSCLRLIHACERTIQTGAALVFC